MGYYERAKAVFLAHDLGRDRGLVRPDNRFAEDFSALRDHIDALMGARTIRAWHYTRLTDREVARVRADGVHLSTPASLRQRLDAMVADGDLTAAQADQLWAQNMFTHQHASRADKFWAVSHPLAVTDHGVVPLMSHWGGEAASMWLRDESLLAHLAALGRPRVLELGMPLGQCQSFGGPGRAVLATFGRAHGACPEKCGFDLYAKAPLEAGTVLGVHSEGEASFGRLGDGFPAGFVDVDRTHWTELTGEDD